MATLSEWREAGAQKPSGPVAGDLATAVEEVSDRFPAYYGMWVGSYLRGELAPMQKMATAILRDAESRPASPEAAMPQRIYGMTCWYAGNFVAAQKHLEQALAINATRHQRKTSSASIWT